jgi:nucleotidyltransferase/DNA polymerase involved in DNA repair
VPIPACRIEFRKFVSKMPSNLKRRNIVTSQRRSLAEIDFSLKKGTDFNGVGPLSTPFVVSSDHDAGPSAAKKRTDGRTPTMSRRETWAFHPSSIASELARKLVVRTTSERAKINASVQSLRWLAERANADCRGYPLSGIPMSREKKFPPYGHVTLRVI